MFRSTTNRQTGKQEDDRSKCQLVQRDKHEHDPVRMIKKKWIDSCSSTSRPQNTKMTLFCFSYKWVTITYLLNRKDILINRSQVKSNLFSTSYFFDLYNFRIISFSFYVITYYSNESLKYIISNPAWYLLTCTYIVIWKEHWIVKYSVDILYNRII